jgi:hypothetical protein
MVRTSGTGAGAGGGGAGFAGAATGAGAVTGAATGAGAGAGAGTLAAVAVLGGAAVAAAGALAAVEDADGFLGTAWFTVVDTRDDGLAAGSEAAAIFVTEADRLDQGIASSWKAAGTAWLAAAAGASCAGAADQMGAVALTSSTPASTRALMPNPLCSVPGCGPYS